MRPNIILKEKTVLITGATRGIGKAIADEFLRAGASVVLTGTNKIEIEQKISKNKNPKITWLTADFSTQQGVDAFKCELKNVSSIDVCVNNAGINIIKSFEECSIDEYQHLLAINLTAPFLLLQHILPYMKKKVLIFLQNYQKVTLFY